MPDERGFLPTGFERRQRAIGVGGQTLASVVIYRNRTLVVWFNRSG